MIADKFVDLYARNSGLRDKLIAERDVVLTYALRVLVDTGMMNHLVFKGGTCLRKLVFGSAGRFSEDLDFTIDSVEPEDDVLMRLVETLNGEYFGITFVLDAFYKTDDETSFGGDVLYRHSWNDAGRFRLQVSLRERPTLMAMARPLQHQGYFDRLEFSTFSVRSLNTIEMIAEKVRAAFQRAKVRDLYDLHRFATTPFDGGLLRSLVVLKLWQMRDPFVPELLFDKLRSGKYDWGDLQRLLRTADRVEPDTLITTVERRFEMLRHLTELERAVIADARHPRSPALAERLRAEIRSRAASGG